MPKAPTRARRPWLWATVGLGLGIAALATLAFTLASYQTTEDLHLVRTEHDGVVTYEVQPERLRSRTQTSLDGVPTDNLAVDLNLAGAGRHVVKAAIERRGGRYREVSQVVVGGPFARRGEAGARRCGLGLAISGEAIDDLLRPMLETELLGALRDNEYFGPDTTIDSAEFELFPRTVRFSITVAGANRLLVEGWLLVEAKGERSLEVRLIRLSEVDFQGKLRRRANAAGAAVGSTLGPIGAVVGYVAVDRYVSKKARETVHTQLVDGLAELTDLELLPAQVELFPGEARSAVALGFCEGTDTIVLSEAGVAAAFYAEPIDWGPMAGAPAEDRAVPHFETQLTAPKLGPADDVLLDISLDQTNRVIDAWQANGLLQELVDAQGWSTQVDEQLREWTQLTLAGVSLRRAPFVEPSEPQANQLDGVVFPYTVADVFLDLEGPTTGEWTDIELSLLGRLEAGYDTEADSLVLQGSLDELVLSCTRDGQLWPCYAELLSLSEAQQRIDEQLRAANSLLPAISVRQMLLERTDGVWDLHELRVHAAGPASDRLRLRATLRN